MSSVEIVSTAPSGMVIPKMVSTSKHIVKNVRYHRIPADANVNYTYAGNNRISFTIASTDSFWDPSESFLQFEYTTACTGTGDSTTNFRGTAAAGVNEAGLSGSWSKGGAHCAIRSITVETQSGVLCEHINEYGRLFGLISASTESRQYVDLIGSRYHDSTGQYWEGDGLTYEDVKATDVNATAIGGVGWGPVLQFQNATNAAAQANIIAGNPLRRSARAYAGANGASSQQVCLKLMSGFLNLSFVPLQYIRQGIRIHLDLQNPELALVLGTQPTNADVRMNYTITNPIMHCRFIMPDAAIKQQYDKALQNGMLNFEFDSFGYSGYQHNGAIGTIQYTIPVSKRSVKNVFVVAQNRRANAQAVTADAFSSSNYDMNNFIRANVTSYRFQHASDYYPSLPITIASGGTSISNASALEALLQCWGKSTSLYDKVRFKPSEWNSLSSDSGNANECQSLIMSFPLARDMGSEFCGLDTSNSNQLIVELVCAGGQYQINAVNENIYFHNFVQYNNILSITPLGVVIRS
jgi:hypothetical protein